MSVGTYSHVDDSDQLFVLGELLRPLLTVASGSSIEVFDTRGPADAGPPRHRHPWEENYIVLSGELEVWVDGEIRCVGPGGVAHIPAGVNHGYRNVTDSHFLTIVSRGNASAFFAGAAATIASDPNDFMGLLALAERLGVENAG